MMSSSSDTTAVPQTMSLRWYWSFVPPLFSLAPLLTLYAGNATEVSVANAVTVIAALFLSAWVLAAIPFFLLPAKRGAVVVAASVLTALFFYYGYLFNWLSGSVLFIGPVTIGPNKIVAAAMVLSVAAAWWLARRSSETLSRTAQVAAAIGLTLAVTAAVPAFLAARAAHQDVVGSPDAPLTVSAATSDQELPDIYLLILDGYASDAALRGLSNFDNTPFTSWLRSEGFYVVEQATSNYSWTALSVPATLNMRYVNDEVRDLAPKDRARLDMLTQHSATVRTLKEQGYRYTHVASGMGADNAAPLADQFIGASFDEMLDTALSSTALSAVGIPQWLAARAKYHDVTAALRAVGQIAEDGASEPQLVVAHVMAPHPPAAFTAEGELNTSALLGSTRGTVNTGPAAYTEEVVALNGMVQATFEKIRRENSRPFVVIIQADHGYLFDELELSPKERYLGRTGVLNAIYFSDGGYDELYPTMSLVNTFRVVFNRCLGTSLPLLEDRSYFSEYATPYDFTDVTDQINR